MRAIVFELNKYVYLSIIRKHFISRGCFLLTIHRHFADFFAKVISQTSSDLLYQITTVVHCHLQYITKNQLILYSKTGV